MDNRSPSSNMINERRQYFRVKDEVLLCYLAVDEDCALAGQFPNEFSNDIGFTLLKELQKIDNDNHQLLRNIGHLNQDLQLYLTGLNKKLELITSQLIGSLAPETSKQQQRLKCAFDPQHLLNPGKVFPQLHRCAELGRLHVHHGKLPHSDLPRF